MMGSMDGRVNARTRYPRGSSNWIALDNIRADSIMTASREARMHG